MVETFIVRMSRFWAESLLECIVMKTEKGNSKVTTEKPFYEQEGQRKFKVRKSRERSVDRIEASDETGEEIKE